MPKYDFKCDGCGFVEENIMSFDEAELGYLCEECTVGVMRRQFSPDGTVFQVRWVKPKVKEKMKKMGVW